MYQDPAKLGWGDAAPSQQQKELLGVKQYKNPLVSPILAACRLGDGGGFLFCAWTSKEPKLTSKHKALRTFDPSSLRADPMLFLNWNQEISWLCSPAG